MNQADIIELSDAQIDQVAGGGVWGVVGGALGVVGAGLGVAAVIAGGPFTIPLAVAAGAYVGVGATLGMIDAFPQP